MKISPHGLSLIKKHEGFVPHIYKDAEGYPTIGYGHLILKGEDFSAGVSEAQAEALLRLDVRIAERAVMRFTSVPLAQQQFDALVSFTFNLGGGALQRSTLRRKVNRGEHAEVPDEFLRWVYAGGRRLRGLVRRRAEEAQMYRITNRHQIVI